jgi:hypothetical protein
LPPAVHATVLDAYAGSLDKAFLVGGFVSIIAFGASWFIKELPMRTTLTAEDLGSAFGAPRPADSTAEMLRALGVLVGRQRMRDWLARVAVEAGVDVPLAGCWVLVQLRREPGVDLFARAAEHKISGSVIDSAISDLERRTLITTAPADPVSDPVPGRPGALSRPVRSVTPAGTIVADELIDAIRDRLAGLLDGWSPEQYPDLARLLQQFASDIVPGERALEGSGARALLG